MTSATTRTPAEVAHAAFDAVIRKDPDGIVAEGAPGYVDDFVAIGEIRGPDGVRAFFSELFAARQIGLLPPQGSRADRGLISAFNAKTRLRQRRAARRA